MFNADVVEHKCSNEDEQCGDDESDNGIFIDGIEEFRQIIDVQILRRIEIRHQ